MSAPHHLAIALFAAPRFAALIGSASPDAAVWTATLGLCLIAIELNRPGLILPGSFGSLLLLLSAASLSHHNCRPWAVCVLAASAILSALNWWKKLPLVLLGATPLASTLGLRFLLAPADAGTIHTPVALICGATSGVLGAVLSRIAFRARRLKAVN